MNSRISRKRNPDLHQMRRQPEDIAELPVRADQLQIGVEHRDALPHMVERGLQYLAVEMQRGVGIVEQFQRGLGGHGALAQQQRHHHARGGGADRRGDQVLGMLEQFEIGRRRRLEMDMVGEVAKASKECRARSGPRYCATVVWISCTVTVVRQRRKVGAIGASAFGTNRSACTRSIEEGWRASESTT